MRNFGEDLNFFLKENGLTQDKLSRWIVELSPKDESLSVSGVKEKLRQARLKRVAAFQYPYLSELISFLNEEGKHSLASRLQAVLFAQCHRRQLIGDISAPSEHLPLLNAIRFPNDEDSSPELALWRRIITEGDYELYRRSLSLYYQYTNSYMHAGVRRTISMDLAKAALTYGDYSDAFVIARRFESAFMRRLQNHAREMRCRSSTKALFRDQFDCVISLHIKAVALSFLIFFSPVEASEPYFRRAKRARMAFLEDDLLDQEDSESLEVHWLTQNLRVHSRAVWAGTADKPQSDELRDMAWGLARHVNKSQSKFKSFFIADTLARAFALSSSTIEQASLGEQWHASANEYCHAANQQEGNISKLREYQRLVTRFILLCKTSHLAHKSEELLAVELKETLANIVRSVGPHRMKHTRFSLITLKEFDFHDLQDAFSKTPRNHTQYLSTDPLLDNFLTHEDVPQLIKETVYALEVEAGRYQEIFFDASVGGEEHRICLEHMLQ